MEKSWKNREKSWENIEKSWKNMEKSWENMEKTENMEKSWEIWENLPKFKDPLLIIPVMGRFWRPMIWGYPILDVAISVVLTRQLKGPKLGPKR